MFEWSDSYSVGNPRIDEEHRRLLHLCQRAHEEQHNFHEVLNDFAELAQRHIQLEELIFANSERHADHRAQYARLVEWMVSSVSRKNYAEHIFQWLMEHLALNQKCRAQFAGQAQFKR